MRKQWNQNRSSFTLVELLVVIVIIGMLAALITQTVMSAMTAAREATIKLEVSKLATALNAYKAEIGEFPPDYSDPAAVERHIRLRWPRINATELNTIRNLSLDRDQSYVFWLRGFTSSPTHPYSSNGKRVSMFDFDKARLVDRTTGVPVASVTDFPVYVAAHGNRSGDGKIRPYIYFESSTYATSAYAPPSDAVKRPYLSDLALETYAGQDSFQLIHAGLDGEWGQAAADTASYPSGVGYLPDDRDNIVNFSKGRTLDDDIP